MNESELRAQLEACHLESFGWALSCCGGCRPDAEDLLHASYLKVLQGKARFEERSEFKTWLFGVIRRTALEESRRRMFRRLFLLRHEREREAPADPRGPGASLEGAELRDIFRQALDDLPTRQREVLHLVFYQELTISEAAEVMRVSLGAARQHYERGKANLRRRLKPELDSQPYAKR